MKHKRKKSGRLKGGQIRPPIPNGTKFGHFTVVADGGVEEFDSPHNVSGVRQSRMSVVRCGLCGKNSVHENRLLRSGNDQSDGCNRAELGREVLMAWRNNGGNDVLESLRDPKTGIFRPLAEPNKSTVLPPRDIKTGQFKPKEQS